jgi:hypothetical protein
VRAKKAGSSQEREREREMDGGRERGNIGLWKRVSCTLSARRHSDLKRCGSAQHFLNTFINVNKVWLAMQAKARRGLGRQ